MARMNTILIGKITKVNGFEGAVTVKTGRSFTGKIPQAGPVFLEIEGRPVPFFVEHSEMLANDLYRVKFEDYNSAEKVKEFAGCNILVTSTQGTGCRNSSSENLAGFLLESEEGITLGIITEIIENPGQLLLKALDKNDREYLIPLHEDLIVSIDPGSKKIIMTIPEGLIDLNL